MSAKKPKSSKEKVALWRFLLCFYIVLFIIGIIAHLLIDIFLGAAFIFMAVIQLQVMGAPVIPRNVTEFFKKKL